MRYNSIYTIFRKSPELLRKLTYFVPIKYRLGGNNFTETYSFLKKSGKWNKIEISKWQGVHLEKLLKHAVKNVPFYKNIRLSSNDPFKNLEKFPIIDKETIQEDLTKFISTNIPESDAYYVSTGGTSGNQLKFYLDNSTYGKEWAFVMTAWGRIGFSPGDRIVSFRGVEFNNADKGIYWQINPIYNTLEMSPFHMGEENLNDYVKKIKDFKPNYIHGYPSAISILAKYIQENNENLPPIKGILAVSENIYPWQRKLLEKAFNARVFSFYGQSERVIMASECEYSTKYHIFPEYGITELIDDNNYPVNIGKRGELVGTSFLNYYMPFIRYKTGDFAVLDGNECPCGRNHMIIKDLVGRWNQEMIFAKDGSLISTTALNLHSDVLEKIIKYQFYQDTEGELVIKIIPKQKFSIEDENKIKMNFYNKIGSNLDIIVEEVTEIPLTERGKHRFLIQKMGK